MFYVRSIRIPLWFKQGRGSDKVSDIRELEKILIEIRIY